MVEAQEVKVVLLGEPGVGKSSLMLRFATDQYKEDIDSTISASYLTRCVKVGSTPIRFNVWDTAGQERFRSLTKMYYRDAMVVMFVFSVTDKGSFDGLRHWLEEVREIASPNIVLALAANKEDLQWTQELSEEEVKRWADAIGAVYKRTSAKTNYGVEQLFREVGRQLFPSESAIDKSFSRLSVRLTTTKRRSKKNCC